MQPPSVAARRLVKSPNSNNMAWLDMHNITTLRVCVAQAAADPVVRECLATRE
jgi:hypothetical protein